MNYKIVFSKLRHDKAYKQAKFAVKNISNDMINYGKKEIKYAYMYLHSLK